MDTASAVYQAADAEGDYEYGSIVMIGHSLGSVVTYDTLNALIPLLAHVEYRKNPTLFRLLYSKL